MGGGVVPGLMRYVIIASLLGFAACGEDDGSTTDARTDTVQDSAADTIDDSAVDSGGDTAADTADTADGDTSTTFGFEVRVPEMRQIPFEQIPGQTTTIEQSDIDYVCRVDADGFAGWVYVRADAVSCGGFTGCQYSVSGAWQKVGDTISELAGATYDYGGNHHNDHLLVPHGAHTLKIYHSSFGFGWRSCAPPDCAQIYSDADLLTDGCGADRALPSPCVMVQPDGSVPAIPDTFDKCNGDPNVTPE